MKKKRKHMQAFMTLRITCRLYGLYFSVHLSLCVSCHTAFVLYSKAVTIDIHQTPGIHMIMHSICTYIVVTHNTTTTNSSLYRQIAPQQSYHSFIAYTNNYCENKSNQNPKKKKIAMKILVKRFT